MVVNSLSPAFARVKYTRNTLEHIMTIPVNYTGSDTPGADPLTVDLTTPAGTISFAGFIDDLVAVLTGFFNNVDVSFTVAELWSQPTPDDDPVFICLYEIGEAGTSVGATVASGQAVMSFRTANGGIYRMYLMETSTSPNIRDDYPFAAGVRSSLATYVKGVDCPIIGRDGGRIVAAIRFLTKTNDALRKRNLLDS